MSFAVIQEVSDSLNGDVCCGVFLQDFGIERVMALADEDGRDTVSPDFFYGCENANFVIDEDVMFGRATALNVFQFLFFVHIDQHVAVDSFIKP